ncbi:MAG TPA: cobyrinate a,c-diamide synthase, partial [Thermoanaerobaculia bacterium]|nr:cobyrinate a,c-diamide synthase [Thermoanaerobaculia bacterium]
MPETLPPAVLVSGTHSGVGKTTVSLLLMEALGGLAYRVQPFKVGPDFIDPGYHRLLTGRESWNLDLWMMGLGSLRRTLATAAADADVAVIEGVGALFDGENGTRERGSAGFLARRLGVPVVLVVDVWGMTRSTYALLDGFL